MVTSRQLFNIQEYNYSMNKYSIFLTRSVAEEHESLHQHPLHSPTFGEHPVESLKSGHVRSLGFTHVFGTVYLVVYLV